MPSTETQFPQSLFIPRLPLAVYREIAAHLRQVEDVTVELLPQRSTEFEYLQSQVGGLQVDCPDRSRQRVEQILAYYGDRYGSLAGDPARVAAQYRIDIPY